MTNMTDKERAAALNLSLDEYYKLVPAENSDDVVKKALAKGAGSNHVEGIDWDEAGFGRGNPGQLDVEQMDAGNLEVYWNKAPSTDEEKALFYGFHIHTKDNPYGLHTHMAGGKLGGSHKHDPQNRLGFHTHAVDIKDLPTEFLISPDAPVHLDGPHEHYMQAPDGKHSHNPQNFA